jgi:hypothetical protein
MEEGKIERSKIFLATKVNMMGLGTYPCEGVCGEREGCHSYDEEIVMHACKVRVSTVLWLVLEEALASATLYTEPDEARGLLELAP